MKLGKINFFKRIYLAIADFRLYPYAQKEKLSTAVGYFIKLIMLMSVVIDAFMTSNFLKESPMLLNMYIENMPEFSVENGILQTEESTEKELNSNTYLILNNDYTSNQLNKITFSEANEHEYYILLLSDTAVLGFKFEDGIHELARIDYENMSFNKQYIANVWESFNNSFVSKLIIWLGISLGIFITFSIIRLWTLIMYLISSYMINFMFGLKMKITDYLKMVIYVSTLPIILEVIALLFVGNISESVNFISVLVSCVYIFYALRAIKLDSLILGGSGKTAEEKIKNALEHAQKELEKQLEELEAKEESEKDKENEKKEIENLNNELKEKEENLIKAQKEYENVLKKVVSMSEEKQEKEDRENEDILKENVKKNENNDKEKEE